MSQRLEPGEDPAVRTIHPDDADVAFRDALADLFHVCEGDEICVLAKALTQWEPARSYYQDELEEIDGIEVRVYRGVTEGEQQ